MQMCKEIREQSERSISAFPPRPSIHFGASLGIPTPPEEQHIHACAPIATMPAVRIRPDTACLSTCELIEMGARHSCNILISLMSMLHRTLLPGTIHICASMCVCVHKLRHSNTVQPCVGTPLMITLISSFVIVQYDMLLTKRRMPPSFLVTGRGNPAGPLSSLSCGHSCGLIMNSEDQSLAALAEFLVQTTKLAGIFKLKLYPVEGQQNTGIRAFDYLDSHLAVRLFELRADSAELSKFRDRLELSRSGGDRLIR